MTLLAFVRLQPKLLMTPRYSSARASSSWTLTTVVDRYKLWW